jgi:hypothetical protein
MNLVGLNRVNTVAAVNDSSYVRWMAPQRIASKVSELKPPKEPTTVRFAEEV